jgi:hypothetical protein
MTGGRSGYRLWCLVVHVFIISYWGLRVKGGATEQPFDEHLFDKQTFDQSEKRGGESRTLSFALNFDGGGRGCDSVRTIRGWQGPKGAGRQ